MIKKFSILFAAIAAMFISTPVSADDVIETDISVVSRYVWRGSSDATSVSLQPSATLPIESNIGLTSINVWGNVPWSGNDTEYNFSFTQSVNDIGSIGITSYYYDGAFL